MSLENQVTRVSTGMKDTLKTLINKLGGNVTDALSDLSDDDTHRTVTDVEKTEWSSKSNFSGDYNDLSNIPSRLPNPSALTFSGAFIGSYDGSNSLNVDNTLSHLIEYDGIQHFMISNSGWNTTEHHSDAIRRDKIKTEYCLSHGIPLARIPYTRFDNLCLEDLLLPSTDFLCAG